MPAGAADGPVLLVGGGGRVGRLVRWHWPADRAGLILSWRRGPPPPGDPVHWAPLAGPGALLAHLDRTGTLPRAMIVLAGVTPGAAGGMADNAAIAAACLAAAAAAGIGRVLLSSSSAVYGVDPEGRPFAEDDAPQPLSDYGRAKLAMEAAAAPWRQAGLAVTALRIGNVAGADALLAGRAGPVQGPLEIDAFADGQGPLRSYIGPGDMARVLAGLALHAGPLPAVLNLAALRPVRMMALATAAGLPWRPVPAPPTARQVITLDCGRLAGLCPDTPGTGDPAAMVAQWKAALPP